jgi:hypothetical protein
VLRLPHLVESTCEGMRARAFVLLTLSVFLLPG